MRRLLGPLLVVLAALLSARATTVVPMSLEELTRAARSVVEARALSSWSEWNPTHSYIVTFTRFQVSRTLKGQMAPIITVRQLGGTIGNQTTRVAGLRYFHVGEEAMLFLRPDDQSERHVIVGLMQGDFRITKDASGETIASNGMAGVGAFQHGQMQEFRGSAMRLSDLESQVRRLSAR